MSSTLYWKHYCLWFFLKIFDPNADKITTSQPRARIRSSLGLFFVYFCRKIIFFPPIEQCEKDLK